MTGNEILDEIEKIFPDAQCELYHESDFQLMVAVILSAQTTDASVNKVTPALFTRFRIQRHWLLPISGKWKRVSKRSACTIPRPKTSLRWRRILRAVLTASFPIPIRICSRWLE